MTDKAISWVRQQKSLMPDKPFFMYFAPGAPTRPTTCPPSGPTSTRAGSTQGGTRSARRRCARQKALGVVPAGHRAVGPARGDPGVGRHARRPQAGAGPPDGGLRRVHGAHRPPRRPADRRPRGARRARRHARLLHHRRQRRQRRGDPQRHVQRALLFNGAAEFETDRVDGRARSTSSAPRRPTTTTRWAGPTPWTRRTSGPSRSRRTSAAPATAPSSTGPTASRPGARSAPSSTTSSTWPPTVLDVAGVPEPTIVNGIQQMPLHGVSMAVHVRRRRRPPSGGRRSTSRCSATAASTTRAGRR